MLLSLCPRMLCHVLCSQVEIVLFIAKVWEQNCQVLIQIRLTNNRPKIYGELSEDL